MYKQDLLQLSKEATHGQVKLIYLTHCLHYHYAALSPHYSHGITTLHIQVKCLVQQVQKHLKLSHSPS